MTEREDARALALAAAAGLMPPTVAMAEFQSEGRVLILGTGQAAATVAKQLADKLPCVLLTDEPRLAGRGVTAYDRSGLRIVLGGHLGAFVVRLEGPSESMDLGAALDPDRPIFDLVLDLDEEASIPREWGPPGYFWARNEAQVTRAIATLPNMVGLVEKPKFFQLDATICAHGLPGTEGCRRCLDSCPTEAIRSVDSKIQVDTNLCQGAGSCATTCPTGALTYAFPPRAHVLDSLQLMLRTFREAGANERPVIVFMEERTPFDALARWPEQVLPFEVLEVGSIGMETWLSALALGARAVRILRPRSLTPSIQDTLDEQLDYAHAVLEGLGYESGVLGWLDASEDVLSAPGLPNLPPLDSIGTVSKRGTLFAALDHLLRHATTPVDVIPVPTGAPFGQVQVNPETCTTCLACAFTCPTHALTKGGFEVPSLLFTEAACVQCGLCEVTCPEHAIALEPRLLITPTERLQPRVLHEDEPFACVSCGKHFASAGTIRAVTEKLADHPMFSKSGIEILKTCDECRTHKFG